jgi:sensor histidine kinase YesM
MAINPSRPAMLQNLRPLSSAFALPIAALVTVLVIAIASYHASQETERVLEARTRANVQDLGAATAAAIEKFWIDPWSRTALRMAQSPDLRCIVERAAPDCIERLRQQWAGALRADDNIFFIYVGLAGGRIHFLPDEKPLPDDYDMKSRPWYQTGMRSTNVLDWTAPYAEIITGKSIITAVVPLREANRQTHTQQTQGVFCIDISLAQLHTLLQNLYLPAGASLVLFDAAGNRLDASDSFSQIDSSSLPDTPGIDEATLAGRRYLRHTRAPLSNGWRLQILVEHPAAGVQGLTPRDIQFVALFVALLIVFLALWGVAHRLFVARSKTVALVHYFAAAAKGAPLTRIFPEHSHYALINSYFNRALKHARQNARKREQYEKDAFELAFLRAQINPHFLHNALNTILNTLHEDVGRAHALLVHLNAYLRNSFDFWSEDQFVPLHAEIELVDDWLAIEAARFEHGVFIHFDIRADRRRRVPAAMLQPIIENALHHGILEHRDSGRIDVRIVDTATAIEFSVADDGVGFDPVAIRQQPGRRGIGLENIHRRLSRLYGSGLVIDSAPGSGTRIAWRVPLDPEPDHA